MSNNPGHYTASDTRKFQANGPTTWSKVFKAVAGRDGREGEGIRAALAFAVDHREQLERWAAGHPDAWAPARTAPLVKVAKTAKAPKAKTAKAPKAKTAKAPKAKTAKAPKAKTAKAPKASHAKKLRELNDARAAGEQLEMPDAK